LYRVLDLPGVGVLYPLESGFSIMAVMSDTSVIPGHLSAVCDRMGAHFETYT